MRVVYQALSIFMVVSILLLTGCSLHNPATQYETPEAPLSWNQALNNQHEPVRVSARWWQQYNDETLNHLMKDVLEHNSDISQAYYRVLQASAYATGKKSERYPGLSISGIAKSEDSDAYTTDVSTYTMSLAAQYELDVWGKIRAAGKAAAFSRQASMYDLQAMYISITAQTAELYFRAVEGNKKLKLCRENVRLLQEYVTLISLNYEQGIVDSSKEYSARQALANAKAEQILQEAAFRKTIHALSILKGKYPESTESYTFSELTDVKNVLPTGIPSDLLKNRPDIQKMLSTLKSDDHEIGVAVANRFPSISLSAGIGRSGTDLSGSMVSSSFSNIAGNLLMPVLDWGKRKSEVKRTRAAFKEILAGYQKAVLTGFKETEDAITDYSAALSSFDHIHHIGSLAEIDAKRIEANYLSGLGTYSAVIVSKTEMIGIQKRINEARLQVRLNNISLVRALGGTWMAEYIHKKDAQED